jgi:DNA-directed RNA polymerase subunit M/transcription elongation factor TFIIS
MDCPLCQSALVTEADKIYFICSNCGAYVKSDLYYLDAADEKSRYEEHLNDVADVRYQKFTSPISNYILKHYNETHLGLDYGSGTAPVITETLTKKGLRVIKFDPFFHPDPLYLTNRYHYIFSCEVFEHFFKPKEEIEKLLGLLHAGGRLIVMTHLYDPSKYFKTWYYRNDPTHVFIFTEKTIAYLTAAFGLVVEHQDARMIVWQKPH